MFPLGCVQTQLYVVTSWNKPFDAAITYYYFSEQSFVVNLYLTFSKSIGSPLAK